MGILNNLRQEFSSAMDELRREAEAQKVQEVPKTGPRQGWGAKQSKLRAPTDPTAGGNARGGSGASASGGERVQGRLQRQALVRVPPGPAAIPRNEPLRFVHPDLDGPLTTNEATSDSFRRHVAQMEGEHDLLEGRAAGSLFARPAPAASTSSVPPPNRLSLSAPEILRGFILGEVMDEPKGRRTRRSHPR